MEHSIETIRTWMACLKVDDPVLPNDPRYLDLQRFPFDGKEIALRGRDWIEPMHKCILFGEGESCQLFSGFRGTGKSTELLRLQVQLEKDGYTVLMIDMTKVSRYGTPAGHRRHGGDAGGGSRGLGP